MERKSLPASLPLWVSLAFCPRPFELPAASCSQAATVNESEAECCPCEHSWLKAAENRWEVERITEGGKLTKRRLDALRVAKVWHHEEATAYPNIASPVWVLFPCPFPFAFLMFWVFVCDLQFGEQTSRCGTLLLVFPLPSLLPWLICFWVELHAVTWVVHPLLCWFSKVKNYFVRCVPVFSIC